MNPLNILQEDAKTRISLLQLLDSDPTSESAKERLAKLIDLTLLKPEATDHDLNIFFDLAESHMVRSVCISPSWVSLAANRLKRTEIRVCTVIGFPHGNVTTQTKINQVQEALDMGASEIDFVHNIGLLKGSNWKSWEDEVAAIVKVTKNNISKIILETSLLTADEITQAATRAAMLGVSLIKTSTGYASRGASADDIKTIKFAVEQKLQDNTVGIKASGGISTWEAATAFVRLGATRLGASRIGEILGSDKQNTDSGKKSGY